MKSGVPDVEVGVVDVRNVAEAHIKAGFTPTAKGRYIVSGQNASFLDIAKPLQESFKEFPIPTKTAPKWLIWLLAPIIGVTRKFVTHNIGYPMKVDNSKSIQELGLSYIPMEQTVNEFFKQLVDEGCITAPR